MGPANRIASEKVDLRDVDCAIKLLIAVACGDSTPEKTDAALLKRLRAHHRMLRKHLKA